MTQVQDARSCLPASQIDETGDAVEERDYGQEKEKCDEEEELV